MYLVLTSAVTPNVSGKVASMDPRARMREYLAAITQWDGIADALSLKPVLIETTEFGAQNVLDRARVNGWIAYDFLSNDRQRAAGKGAVEAACLDEFSSDLGASDFIVKVTGRLYVTNAKRVLSGMGNLDSLHVRMTYGRPWADTRMFALSVALWRKRFLGMSAAVDDVRSRYLELEFGSRCMHALADGVRVQRFEARPRWQGMSGSTGGQYGSLADKSRAVLGGGLEKLLVRVVERKQM